MYVIFLHLEFPSFHFTSLIILQPISLEILDFLRTSNSHHFTSLDTFLTFSLYVRDFPALRIPFISLHFAYQLYVPSVLTVRNSSFCPHIALMCFMWISEQTAIVSLYSIDWLLCITETECVYCAVRTGSLYIIHVMCFVWISEQTAIITLYSINILLFVTEMKCLLRGTN